MGGGRNSVRGNAIVCTVATTAGKQHTAPAARSSGRHRKNKAQAGPSRIAPPSVPVKCPGPGKENRVQAAAAVTDAGDAIGDSTAVLAGAKANMSAVLKAANRGDLKAVR